MSRLWAYTKLGLSTNPFIPAASRGKVAAATVEVCAAEVEYLADTVKRRGKGCSEAKNLMVKCEKTVTLYIQQVHGGRHSIGSDIAQNNEGKCNEFLVDYYSWLSKKLYEEAGEVRDMPLLPKPKLPLMPTMPKIPSFSISTGTKIIVYLVLGFIALIMLLVALGYSGAGEAVGGIAESEVKRKRS